MRKVQTIFSSVAAPERRDQRHRVGMRILDHAHLRFGAAHQVGGQHAQVVAVARAEHHAVFAEAHRLAVAVQRGVGDVVADRSWAERCRLPHCPAQAPAAAPARSGRHAGRCRSAARGCGPGAWPAAARRRPPSAARSRRRPRPGSRRCRPRRCALRAWAARPHRNAAPIVSAGPGTCGARPAPGCAASAGRTPRRRSGRRCRSCGTGRRAACRSR